MRKRISSVIVAATLSVALVACGTPQAEVTEAMPEETLEVVEVEEVAEAVTAPEEEDDEIIVSEDLAEQEELPETEEEQTRDELAQEEPAVTPEIKEETEENAEERTVKEESQNTDDSSERGNERIVLHSFIDAYGDEYILYASTATPMAGTELIWNAIDEGCVNQICALTPDRKVNYDTAIETSIYGRIPDEAYARNGICAWMNAWECGFDAVVFWYPDGTVEVNREP